MRTKLALLLLPAVALWAADFWQTKPYTDWSQKEIQKIMTDSPWVKKVSVTLPGGAGRPSTPGIAEDASGGRGGGGGRRGNSGPQGDGANAGAATDTPLMLPAVQLYVRWQSAMPVKQALVKAKYGDGAGTSEEAKKALEQPEQYYILAVSGFPAKLLPQEEGAEKTVLQQTSLAAKGKDALQPASIKAEARGSNVDLYFLFPRTAMFTAEDKEVEFNTKLGTVAIKAKFRPKDMAVSGKLDL